MARKNPTKCVFGVTSGTLMGHIVSRDGISIDPDKVKAIIEVLPLTNAKTLSRFLGQIRWHSRMIRFIKHQFTNETLREREREREMIRKDIYY